MSKETEGDEIQRGTIEMQVYTIDGVLYLTMTCPKCGNTAGILLLMVLSWLRKNRLDRLHVKKKKVSYVA